jgi:uncharacterized protein YkwD
MRTLLSLMALLGFVAVAPAQEPPPPRTDKVEEHAYAPMPPVVVLYTGVGDKGEIHVEVRETKYVTYTENIEVIKKVDGKDVKSVVPVAKVRSISIMVTKQFPLDKEAAQVITANGKPVKLEDAVKRLEKKTPILISYGGPPDPFYLQTTKPETLIFIVSTAPNAPQPVAPMPPKVKPMPPASTKPRAAIEPTAVELETIDRANVERQSAQLAPLVADPLLTKAARQHSANMAKKNRLDHMLDNKGVGDRLRDVGFAWSVCGENIAWGQRTPAEAVDSWMKSPGHRANILGAAYSRIGVAVADGADGQKYWTMVLAQSQ